MRIIKGIARHKLGLLGAAIITIIGVLTIITPLITAYSPNQMDLSNIYAHPSAKHILGTDRLGRDISTRLLYGGRVSLQVGIIAVLLQITIGVTLGALSGSAGGWIDTLIQRITEVFLAFPLLIIVLVFMALFGTGLPNVILALGIFGWPGICRLTRGELLSIREEEYIMAAKALGIPMWRIILVHALPNAVAPVLVAASFNSAAAILQEAALDFLGFGIQPPTPSWGIMMTVAQDINILLTKPWVWIPPGIAVATLVLSINFLGDALRDALDPQYYKRIM